MEKGIVYIAFDRDYDNVAAHAIAYSRQFTDLPICVFTNLDEDQRSVKWNDVKKISFHYIKKSVKFNRDLKTKMFEYTPFDLSLCLDCDCIIQHKGIENLFDFSKEFDIALCVNLYWKENDSVLKIYKEAMKLAGSKLPITIYSGAFQLFRKTRRVADLYSFWNQYWKMNGSGRDMPALNCAVQNSGVQVLEIKTASSVFAAEHKQEQAIIQHRYTGDFCERFGLPDYKPWKPFDTDPNNFTWVEFDS